MHRPAEKSDYEACRGLFQELRKKHKWDGWFQRVVFDDYADKTANGERHIQELFFDNGKLVGYVRATHLQDKTQTTIYETLVDPDDITTMKTLLDFVAEEAAVAGSARVVAKYTDVPGTIELIQDICGYKLHHREVPIKEKVGEGSIRKPVLAFVYELDADAVPYKPKKHPNYKIVL